MPRLARQKQKILYLARFLLEETDEDHPASVQDMIRFLEQNGIGAERKSIYSDLEELSAFGLDIVSVRGRTTGYFIGNRAFELPEVRLLVDAVQSSRFLTRKKSEDLSISACASARMRPMILSSPFIGLPSLYSTFISSMMVAIRDRIA